MLRHALKGFRGCGIERDGGGGHVGRYLPSAGDAAGVGLARFGNGDLTAEKLGVCTLGVRERKRGGKGKGVGG